MARAAITRSAIATPKPLLSKILPLGTLIIGATLGRSEEESSLASDSIQEPD
jgi:hypothetical protein